MDAPVKLPLTTRLKQRAGLIVGSMAVIAACVAIRNYAPPEPVSAKPPVLPQKPAAAPRAAAPAGTVQQASANTQTSAMVAMVNGVEISRDELGRECRRHHGVEVLESMVNKQLIAEYCRQKNVVVTQQEVDAEIDRMSRKFSLPKDQWLKMLEKERGIKPAQYSSDIIWPTLALRKLAAANLTVSKQELEQAFEGQFGPAVKARLIAVKQRQLAEQVRAQAVAKPDEFGALARKHSEDVNSASANGLIQPIRRGLGDKNLEQVAFSLQVGAISPVIPVADQFVILKCEEKLPAAQVDRAQVDPILEEALRDRKLRTAAGEVFNRLQEQTKVVNVYNDPELSKQMPGVAATVGNRKITIRELTEECITRHGVEVLEGTIHHKLLEQALKKRQLTVTDADMENEIARAAVAMGKTDRAGKPDIEGWLETVTKQQNITEEIYLHDAVWPSVALKKLVGDNVKITEEDLQKGFEANYGPRVRCRAIVCGNQRKAQEVWEKARRNPTAENFGDLAEQYSIEANSRSLRGEVPPIQKFGGQPKLEEEAFKLEPGELSGIIQVGENFVVLLCEGHTQPTKVEYKEVRNLLYDDIREKKQRIAMGKEFELLKDNAQIDNFLAGTMHTPKREPSVAGKPTTKPQAVQRR